MPQIVLLSDENIIEGVIGAITLVTVAYTLSHIIHAPRSIILGMSFIISWFLRRVGVNLYQYLKKNSNIFAQNAQNILFFIVLNFSFKPKNEQNIQYSRISS